MRGKDTPPLGDQRDAAPRDFVRRQRGDVLVVEDDPPLRSARLAEDRHHQRRFAGAVGADQRHHLADLNRDVDSAQRMDCVRNARAAPKVRAS